MFRKRRGVEREAKKKIKLRQRRMEPIEQMLINRKVYRRRGEKGKEERKKERKKEKNEKTKKTKKFKKWHEQQIQSWCMGVCLKVSTKR